VHVCSQCSIMSYEGMHGTPNLPPLHSTCCHLSPTFMHLSPACWLPGMKSRGVYETPGGTVLLTARRAMESITLDRGEAHLKVCLEGGWEQGW
jgi:hypothetical protein